MFYIKENPFRKINHYKGKKNQNKIRVQEDEKKLNLETNLEKNK